MASITRSSATRLLTGVLVFLTTVQAAVPSMPIANEQTKAIVGAVLMFLVVGVTAWNQYLSVEIRNGAIWPTLIVAVVATLGALNDLINVIPLSASGSQWVRLIITTLTMMLGIFSKQLWPTPAAKVIEEKKSELLASTPPKTVIPPIN